MKRTIFIGDLHGCFEELQSLLFKLNVDFENDRLIVLGDLVHKGPDANKVICFLMEQPVEVLLGNHDFFFLQALAGEIEPYEGFSEIKQSLLLSVGETIEWLRKCPLYIEDEAFVAVHSGLSPWVENLKDIELEVFLSSRYIDVKTKELISKSFHDQNNLDIKPWYDLYPDEYHFNKEIIFGHWAKKEIFSQGRFLGLDTGCCYGGKLSAYILESKEIVQVESLQKKQFNY